MHVKVLIQNKHETPFKVYRINIDLQSKALCGFLILASLIIVNGIEKPHLTLGIPHYLDTLLKRGYLFNVSHDHITFVFMMFIQQLQLKDVSPQESFASLQNNFKPHKVSTFIQFTLNQELLVGCCLECMGVFSSCKVYNNLSKLHILMTCSKTMVDQDVYFKIWTKMGSS